MLHKVDMLQIKTAVIGTFGTGAAFGSVAISLESQVETWVRIAVLLVGFISALISIYWVMRLNRVKLQIASHRLCEDCRNGHIPKHCPIDEEERPTDCPLSKK